MKELKRQFALRWDEFLGILGIILAGFLFGELVGTVMGYATGDKDAFEIGSFMALMMLVLCMTFIGAINLPQHFNLMVSMGAVRRKCLPAYFVVTMLFTAGYLIVAYLLHLVEPTLLHLLVPGSTVERISEVFQWKYLLWIIVLPVPLQSIFGMLLLKFGKAGFWILWGGWMLLFLGGPRILDYAGTHPGTLVRRLVDVLYQAPGIGIALFGLVVSGIVAGIGYFFLLRQQVTV